MVRQIPLLNSSKFPLRLSFPDFLLTNFAPLVSHEFVFIKITQRINHFKKLILFLCALALCTKFYRKWTWILCSLKSFYIFLKSISPLHDLIRDTSDLSCIFFYIMLKRALYLYILGRFFFSYVD